MIALLVNQYFSAACARCPA